MKVGILFSGGKDSSFALYKALQSNDVKCLITVFSTNPDSFMFHTPNIRFVTQQAEAIGLPIIIKETKGEKEKELEDLKQAIKEAKEKYKLEGIISGAIASRYQKERIEKICKELNLESINPLWGADPEQYMKELIKSGFKIIIVSISAEGLTSDFLGKEIDLEMFGRLKELNKKYGVHIAFEGGEAETFCLDGPVFKKKIEVKEAEKVMESDYAGLYLIKKIKLF